MVKIYLTNYHTNLSIGYFPIRFTVFSYDNIYSTNFLTRRSVVYTLARYWEQNGETFHHRKNRYWISSLDQVWGCWGQGKIPHKSYFIVST